ncbi:hypothetical protein B0T10DRAFT_20657 [Thelonectria olida]|uniref:Uncharacterized protein n=1 Tax=Thelonectria olida TaxID=1576542 RepID=A0A9P8WHW7_9HYPO|nr:hypothetical protein B0T10DRAFT_20657 [Thelonectria olida]
MTTFARWTMLQRRADDTDTDDNVVYLDDDGVYWWYTDTGMIVKWTVFTTIVVLFMAWLIGGYFHAKKRLQKGMQPLAYHRVLVSRRMRAQYDPNYVPPQPVYGMYAAPNGYGYPMYNMPPPVYDPNRPPMYEPPAGSTKIDPMQDRHYEQPEYQPPPGPPPASMSR